MQAYFRIHFEARKQKCVIHGHTYSVGDLRSLTVDIDLITFFNMFGQAIFAKCYVGYAWGKADLPRNTAPIGEISGFKAILNSIMYRQHSGSI